jgi:hypothetical protein
MLNIACVDQQSEGMQRLRTRLPRLAWLSSYDSRIMIKAELFSEPGYYRYNVYSNRMEVEW